MCRHVSIWGFQNRVRPSVCLSVPREKKSSKLRQYQSYISNCYINGKVFTSTTPWKPKNVKFFQKVRNWRNWILSVPRVSVCREKKSPWLRQYQSYISIWYINGKVFTSRYYNIVVSTKKNDFLKKKHAYRSVLFSLYCAHWLVLSFYPQHTCRSQHISVLTTCTFIFRRVCTVQP